MDSCATPVDSWSTPSTQRQPLDASGWVGYPGARPEMSIGTGLLSLASVVATLHSLPAPGMLPLAVSEGRVDSPDEGGARLLRSVAEPPARARPAPSEGTTRSMWSELPAHAGVAVLLGAAFAFPPDAAGASLEVRGWVSGSVMLGLGLLVPFEDTEEAIADAPLGITAGSAPRAQLYMYPLRAWCGFGSRDADHFMYVGPELMMAFESARASGVEEANRRHRVVPGMGLRGTAGWSLGSSLIVTLEGALDYVLASSVSRFTYTLYAETPPDSTATVEVFHPEALAGFVGLSTGIVF